ncbi:putative glutathionylspermidine synthase [Streptosporangium violaceochromogenes]|nr:putative glutathionylspermidine synthase [Streptosporangium violaceochromogenes]
MRRAQGQARPGWQPIVESQGLGFHRNIPQGAEGRPYWDESVHYVFSLCEVEDLEGVVEELHGMCLEVVDRVVRDGRYADFGLPGWLHRPIEESWRRRDPHLFGRFDLCYDGRGHAKLLEYNADTPTSLVESAVVQWEWMTAVHPGADQWNSIHDRLVDQWRKINPPWVHLAYTEQDASGEDALNVAYMAETAAQAGLPTRVLSMERLGWDLDRKVFVDDHRQPVGTLFKLYPWEWVVADHFGQVAVQVQRHAPWVEPLWKMLLSNKALLALLWELYPDHPNLLPAYLDGPRGMASYIVKPLLGREGASMRIVTPAGVVHTAGGYGAEGHVHQELWPLPEFDGWRPVLGAWVVGDQAAGLGIRETSGPVTDDTSSFVPHLICD